MSSEELGLVPPSRSSLTSQQLLFQDDPSLRFTRVGDPGPKPPDLGSTAAFIEDRFFASQSTEFRRSLFANGPDLREPPPLPARNWNGSDTQSGDGIDGNDEDDEDDEDDDDEVDEGRVREVVAKDGNSVQSSARTNSAEIHHQTRIGNYQSAVTIAEPDGELYYAQYLRGTEVSASGQKDATVESNCGFRGRKDVAFHGESGDSLRGILSDPLTGALMDDAMILPCGHSFGAGGIQQIIGMKACSTCSQSVAEDSILPNLSLRAAVQAFRREEELQLHRASKRRREGFDQEKGSYADSFVDPSRGRGVQFPFAVTDRVIIKGNKRTPQRFVGREAIVTTQCLNGWYVVKTLDNAESVKLQYRSLAKVGDNSTTSKPTSKPTSSKMVPQWL